MWAEGIRIFLAVSVYDFFTLTLEEAITFLLFSIDVKDLRCGLLSLHRNLGCTQLWGQRVCILSPRQAFLQFSPHWVLFPSRSSPPGSSSPPARAPPWFHHFTGISSRPCSSFLLPYQKRKKQKTKKPVLSIPCPSPLPASLQSLHVSMPGIHPAAWPSALALPCQWLLQVPLEAPSDALDSSRSWRYWASLTRVSSLQGRHGAKWLAMHLTANLAAQLPYLHLHVQ